MVRPVEQRREAGPGWTLRPPVALDVGTWVSSAPCLPFPSIFLLLRHLYCGAL